MFQINIYDRNIIKPTPIRKSIRLLNKTSTKPFEEKNLSFSITPNISYLQQDTSINLSLPISPFDKSFKTNKGKLNISQNRTHNMQLRNLASKKK